MTPHPLLTKVERFLAKTKMPPSKFGAEAVNDPHFVRQLREGRDPRRVTVAKAEEFIRTYRRNERGADS